MAPPPRSRLATPVSLPALAAQLPQTRQRRSDLPASSHNDEKRMTGSHAISDSKSKSSQSDKTTDSSESDAESTDNDDEGVDNHDDHKGGPDAGLFSYYLPLLSLILSLLVVMPNSTNDGIFLFTLYIYLNL